MRVRSSVSYISQFDFQLPSRPSSYPNVVTFKVRALHRWLLPTIRSIPTEFHDAAGLCRTAWRYLFNKRFEGAGSGYPECKSARRVQAANSLGDEFVKSTRRARSVRRRRLRDALERAAWTDVSMSAGGGANLSKLMCDAA